MDAALTAQRNGADQIHILFPGPRESLHWHLPESWFSEPGHHARMHTRVTGLETDADGKLTGVHIQTHEPESGSSPVTRLLPVDLILQAGGLQPDPGIAAALPHLTSLPQVRIAGGMMNGGASISQCVAEGVRAAESLDQFLRETRA